MAYKLFTLNIPIESGSITDYAFPKEEQLKGCTISGLAIRNYTTGAVSYNQKELPTDEELGQMFLSLADKDGKGYSHRVPLSLIRQVTNECGLFELDTQISLSESKIYTRVALATEKELEIVFHLK